MKADIAQQLREVIEKAKELIPENEFCGLGVVVYADISNLPILPLCPDQNIDKGTSLIQQLALVSLYSNPCHDGFHFISERLELTHANQYFAPPLPSGKQEFEHGHTNRGARYISAQIGSLIQSVHCTGIYSDRDGLVIFQNGKVV